MPQGLLPFKYQEEACAGGMTALAGLLPYVELMSAIGLGASIKRHVRVRTTGQGYTDKQMLFSLILLNLAGGECVDDVSVLQGDCGLTQVLRELELHGLSPRRRRAALRRWRKEQIRTFPSASSIFRYLAAFHDAAQEAQREEHRAFIPAPNAHGGGLGLVNADLVAFVQKCSPCTQATLDMDATLVETHKSTALYSYKKFRAYQPLNTYWSEQGLMLHSEFRDGNVPAGHEQLRVFQEALALLPQGVDRVFLRSDSAGYQKELLQYCAKGKNPRFGIIEFAISADVTADFRKAALAVPPDAWRSLDGTEQEYAEVAYVPQWTALSKHAPEYRFLALREPLREMLLPRIEEQPLFPFPVQQFGDQGRYKLFGIVTNRVHMPAEELLRWHRQRCGKSEEAHAVMKEDFAGGKLPSADFGENAAWWAIMILAMNLNAIMKRLVLGGNWVLRRMKAMRAQCIALPGRVVHHARQLVVRLCNGHPSNEVLLQARRGILALSLPSG